MRIPKYCFSGVVCPSLIFLKILMRPSSTFWWNYCSYINLIVLGNMTYILKQYCNVILLASLAYNNRSWCHVYNWISWAQFVLVICIALYNQIGMCIWVYVTDNVSNYVLGFRYALNLILILNLKPGLFPKKVISSNTISAFNHWWHGKWHPITTFWNRA